MDKRITIEYKNWKDEISIRTIIPIEKMWFGHTEYHKKDQWILSAYDCDKNAMRDFALVDIIRFIK